MKLGAKIYFDYPNTKISSFFYPAQRKLNRTKIYSYVWDVHAHKHPYCHERRVFFKMQQIYRTILESK